MIVYLSKLFRAPSTYPLGSFWLAAMAVILFIGNGWFKVDTGVIVLTMVAAMLILQADYRNTMILRSQVEHVQHLVNSNNDRLMNRINQLIQALTDHNIQVPDESDAEVVQ